MRGPAEGSAQRGGEAKYLMSRLPGVGQKRARIWYDLGIRCTLSLRSTMLCCLLPPSHEVDNAALLA